MKSLYFEWNTQDIEHSINILNQVKTPVSPNVLPSGTYKIVNGKLYMIERNGIYHLEHCKI
jgi:hypothetical protein